MRYKSNGAGADGSASPHLENHGPPAYSRRRRRGTDDLTLRDLLATGSLYWATIYPRARRELARWDRRAASIPDPVLRDHALTNLTAERLNPEAAALFACTAPRQARARLIALIVAFQVLYDYLDSVNEPEGSNGLVNGLQLHLALTDAVQPREPMRDLYLHNPQRDDCGYAHSLGRTSAALLAALPSGLGLAETLRSAAERCRQAQARNHAVADQGPMPLHQWCRKQADSGEWLWWETAAAGISCLGVHALAAAAADPQRATADAAEIDAAYFPGVCAISALLDSLADHYSDTATKNHSFTAHYTSTTEAAERLITITRQTARRLGALPRHRQHAFILWGVLAYYLSAPTLHPSFSAPVAKAMTQVSGPAARTMRAAMQLRRHIAAKRYSAP